MALCRIGVATADQGLDKLDDIVDMRGHSGLYIGRQYIQRLHVLMVGVDVALGNLANRHARFCRSGIDLVIHIGEVARVDDLWVVVSQQTRQDVKHHRWAGITNMRKVVNRRTAHIQRHPVGVFGAKRLFSTR